MIPSASRDPVPPQLRNLVTAILNTPKYRHISPELLYRIGRDELKKRPRHKEAVKGMKGRLHQIGGAYLDSNPKYGRLLTQLQASDDRPAACRNIMRQHSSTRERLPILDRFYSTIFADLPPIHSVLDIASGFNPLARAWMPLAPRASYTAYDIYGDMMPFLQAAMRLMVDKEDGANQTAVQQDIISRPPTKRAELALILKTLPVLAMVDETAVSRLLDTIQAEYLLISFPVRSLGGRQKGMVQHYDRLFINWMNGRGWSHKRYLFDGELAFLVKKDVPEVTVTGRTDSIYPKPYAP